MDWIKLFFGPRNQSTLVECRCDLCFAPMVQEKGKRVLLCSKCVERPKAGEFVEVTDEMQAAAKAEIDYIIDLWEHLPQSFTYNGLPIVVDALVVLNHPPGKTTKIVSVWVDDECVFRGKDKGGPAWVFADSPEIWAALRPRLQQIADERKAAAEAEKAAKRADVLAKLGGGDGN